MQAQEYTRLEHCKTGLALCSEYLALMQLAQHFTDNSTRERAIKVCQRVQQELIEVVAILEKG